MLPEGTGRKRNQEEARNNPPDDPHATPKASKMPYQKRPERRQQEMASQRSTQLLQSQMMTTGQQFQYIALPPPNPQPRMERFPAHPLQHQPWTVTRPYKVQGYPNYNTVPSTLPSQTRSVAPQRPLLQATPGGVGIQQPPHPHQNNGQDTESISKAFDKDHQAARILMHLVHECERNRIQLPWANVAARLDPTLDGPTLLQSVVNLRSYFLTAGYVVPPLSNDVTANNMGYRGYVRDQSQDAGAPLKPLLFTDRDPPLPSSRKVPQSIYVAPRRGQPTTQTWVMPQVARQAPKARASHWNPGQPMTEPLPNAPVLKSHSNLRAFGNDVTRTGMGPVRNSTFANPTAAPRAVARNQAGQRQNTPGTAQSVAAWWQYPAPPGRVQQEEPVREVPEAESPSRVFEEDYVPPGPTSSPAVPPTAEEPPAATDQPAALTFEDVINMEAFEEE